MTSTCPGHRNPQYPMLPSAVYSSLLQDYPSQAGLDPLPSHKVLGAENTGPGRLPGFIVSCRAEEPQLLCSGANTPGLNLGPLQANIPLCKAAPPS